MTELKPLIEYVPEPKKAFLSQPLTLGMFVPCDEEGNVLGKPKMIDSKGETGMVSHRERLVWFECDEARYKAAINRLIFDEFEATHIGLDTVIESLNGVQIRFMGTETIALVRPFPMKVKTISDLCGLGIKLKER